MKRRMAILAGTLTLAAAAPASAQNAAAQAARRMAEERFGRGPQQQQQQQGAQAQQDGWSASGVIHSVSRNTINLITDQQQPWRVTLAPNAQVAVKGEGGPEMVKPRALVSFFADVNTEGAATTPITELTLHAPSPEFKPEVRAVTPEEEQKIKEEQSGEKPDPRRRNTRRPTPQGGGESEAQPAEQQDAQQEQQQDERQDQPRGGDREAGPSKRFYIQGVVRSVRRDDIVVEIDEARMNGTLAEDAKVKAEFDTLAAASPGDRVEVSGTPMPVDPRRAQFGQAVANSVTVTLTPPPQDPSDRRRAARRGPRDQRRADSPRGAPNRRTGDR